MPPESQTRRLERAVAERRATRGARLLSDGGITRCALAVLLALGASPALGGCVLLNDYGGFTIGEPDAGGADASQDTPDGSADAASPADASSPDAGLSDGGADAGPTDCTTPNTLYVAATGDDSNPGTIDAPLRSVAAAMARAGDDPTITNVYLSAGSFDTTYETDSEINLVDGLTLRGGYSDDFCTYDPATYVSEIVQGYLGGGAVDPMVPPIVSVIGDDLPHGVVLEGFRVSIGEEADDDHVGIRLQNTDAVIRDVTVAEGDGRLMTGIEIHGAASLTMERVTLAMDNASHGSTGVYLIDVVQAALTQIIVDRPVSETMLHSYGIRAQYGSDATSDSAYSLSITRSRIHGGRGGSGSAGISVDDTRTATRDVTIDIRNNLIHGGESASPVNAIVLLGGTGDATIYNNTIFAGQSDAYAVGIDYDYDFEGHDMRNNVLFSGSDMGYCIRQGSGGQWTGDDTQMSNNVFFNCDFALFYDNTNRITDVAALNALTNSTANQVASAVPLVSLAGPDSLVGTMANNDWGFPDASPCTYTDGAYPVSDLPVDYFGNPRDATPSIGAIEFTGTCTP